MSDFIVGLTGGIGSGKSAAATLFAELGVELIDADQAARDVVAPGEPALAAIAEHFGQQILLDDGNLNRQALRELIFSNQAEKDWLENLLHPLVRKRITDFLQQAKSPYALLVSPLMVETGQTAMVNKVIVVDVAESVQLERTCQRDNNSEELVQSIMAHQASREERRAAADFHLNNEGDLADLQRQVQALHNLLLLEAQTLKVPAP